MSTAGVPPPQNLAAERSVLGAVLLMGNGKWGAMPRILALEEGLRVEHFYRDRHRLIFAAMLALCDRDEALDVVTVTAELERAGKLEEAGGKAAIDELTGGVPGLGAVREYSRIVSDCWKRREILLATYAIQAAIASHDDEQLAEGRRMLDATVVAHGGTDGLLDQDALAAMLLDHLDAGGPQEGLPIPPELSGLHEIVRMRPGHTMVLYGWSGMGKSQLGVQFCETFGRNGLEVIIATNEDTALEVAARSAQRASGVSSVSFIDRRLRDHELGRFTRAARPPYKVQPIAGWTAQQIASAMRHRRADVWFVDHIHAIPGASETRILEEGFRALTAAAKQTGCFLIVAAQMNHERDKAIWRPPPVPRDLRQSALLYDLAETVMCVHRDEEEATDAAGRRLGTRLTHETGRIVIDKCKAMQHHNGLIAVTFDRPHARFVQPASQRHASDPEAWAA